MGAPGLPLFFFTSETRTVQTPDRRWSVPSVAVPTSLQWSPLNTRCSGHCLPGRNAREGTLAKEADGWLTEKYPSYIGRNSSTYQPVKQMFHLITINQSVPRPPWTQRARSFEEIGWCESCWWCVWVSRRVTTVKLDNRVRIMRPKKDIQHRMLSKLV